jgi:uncharacterized protein with GYD domain
MPHFMIRASYTQEGIVGLRREGATPRLEVVRQLVAGLGGSMEVPYWAFGETDFLTIVELPDNAAAAAAASTVAASGAASVRTTVLLTAAEVDDARGRTVAYRAPGE